MNNFWAFLDSKVFNTKGTQYLCIGMGIVIVYRFATEFRYSEFFYGPLGTSNSTLEREFGGLVGNFLEYMFTLPLVPLGFSVVWALSAIGMILGKFVRASILIALMGFLIDGAMNITQDGGDNLAKILLFYMVFLIYKNPDSSSLQLSRTRIFVHNLAVIAIYVQLCILYLTSSTAKLGGEYWMNGTAIYYVTHTETFGPLWLWLKDLFKNPFIVTVSTYASIIYQMGFSFMLLNRFHLVWVVFGICLHLGIGITMGLMSFGLVMVSALIFTIRDSEWSWIEARVSSTFRRFSPKTSRA